MVDGCQICAYLTDGTTALFETVHWRAVLAVEQGYLGHTFLTLRRHKPSLSELSSAEWGDLHRSIRRFESAICTTFGARNFNWVCLLNDAFQAPDPKPHVHWKVRPRFDQPVNIAGITFADPNFGYHYDKSHDHDHMAEPGSRFRQELEATLKGHL
jgi:diadenosine tetraphosphate (Ap4A) HIT family hydrolase